MNNNNTFENQNIFSLKHAHTTNFHPSDEEEETFEDDDDVGELSKRKGTIKRLRWGTQRHKNGNPLVRNKTMKKTMSMKRPGKLFGGAGKDDHPPDDEQEEDALDRSKEKREIYWNLPLPESQLDEDGKPKSYARNKIRTTKYTPLSFVPKNLYFQFENVANIYFLTMIILGAFEIFGVPNPALSAVPLIVIVAITAFKDALEDSRRTALDMEVNNQVTHILKGMDNPNFNGESISLWRRLKKLTSKVMIRLIRRMKGKVLIDPLAEEDARRDSFDNRKSIQIEDPEFGLTTSSPTFKKDYWKNIHVGDIVKIKNNDSIPVDLLILSTSDHDGACYVETKNLDGETNLKVKQALKSSASAIKSVNDLGRCKFWLESEGPKSNLYSYQGNLKYYVSGDEKNEIANEPVTINNLLLRGCTLRNTKWVVGIVAFTGDDTKIMMNAGVTPTKRSRIARELNWSVILNFLLLFILCLVSGIVNGIYYNRDNNSRDAFEFGTIAGSPAVNGLVGFVVAIILYQSLVPISLYISIEIIKTAQAYFIYSDVLMYYQRLDYPCTPKSWNISDDLGQIEYIFSDKTGTLTQNVMEFKKCTINGVSYGRAYTEAYAGIRRRQGIDVEEESAREKLEIKNDKAKMIELLKEVNSGNISNDIDEELTFTSKEFADDLKGKHGEAQKLANEHFMLALALCHSVLTEPSETKPGKLELKAQSPDEAALVATARDVGFEFTDRTKKGVVLNVQGVEKEYQILNILEFNSTRKRMSAIIKIPPTTRDGEPTALLICKGADSIIYSRLSNNNDQSLLDKTAVHLEQFATEGLRTLCIAQRELSWSEYEDWQRKHEIASASLDQREEKMEEVASAIEKDLILLGGTAIEDRLQDGVPESISILAKAGIKLWVLTGDKVETAINIGFSCNLLENGMDLLVIKTSGDDIEEVFGEDVYANLKGDRTAVVGALIDKYLRDNFDMTGSHEELEEAKKIHEPPSGNYGVVIDGDALKVALNDNNKYKFLLLCKQCKAVLCCRVSPAQKADVVKLVKDTLDVMTLAIGDGSNDVSMIQAADVGVGIAGEEGTQAVMCADYALGQFRYLTRLVLVHGRWSYKRLSEMIPSFFYKNVIFTIALFWYGIYNDFDGSYLFEYTYLMFYNLAFTSLPVIFMGIFDQDVTATVSVLVPELYRTGILRSEWTTQKFWWYMVDGFYQSLISFFYPYFMYYKNGVVTFNGLPLEHRYFMGAIVASISIVSCDIYILMHQYRWDWLSVLVCSLSILVLFAWTGVWSSSTYSGEFYKAAVALYGTPAFWACFFVGFLVCILPRFCYDFLQKLYYPKDIDIIRECVAKGDFSQYPDDYDPTDPDKAAISKYSKEQGVEEQSHNQIRLTSGPVAPAYRDSINGTGGSRGSIFKRAFSKNKNKDPVMIPVSQSVDTLATEEIEMEFTHGGNRMTDGSLSRPGLSVKRNPGMQTDADRFNHLKNTIYKRSSLDANRRKSLEQTRKDLSYDDEGVRNTSIDRVRTSMEIPGLTTAESLISRFSEGRSTK
ncbi:hypothetical protein CANARDRAFT_195218 [[Candida] arabinofermentans NRRL YB-2248]|uniref:Phospholipid-transporting ATPase n=1 Tax=[Candida] arabinofermentans NRRL YB-2248 TaxID=983967 RepID=A0A1E4T6N6_9ASCO|nr:hypothetical protein CANARDRAFT_195218 [[Candida] arabinofermentans NRRL YB-2248]